MRRLRLLSLSALEPDERPTDLSVVVARSGMVISLVYLCTMNIEYRRREKRFWLWRLVTRPNGRYIVGKCVVPSVVPLVPSVALG